MTTLRATLLRRTSLLRPPHAMLAWLLLVLLVFLAGVPRTVHAQDVRPVPALSARVIDETGTLGPQRDALETQLAAFEQEAGAQIAILMVSTTRPEDIAAYAYRVADTWKIGRRGVGDGILIVVAKEDRQVRIEVAKALEGAIPDLAARQIIDRAFRPAFKAGDYAGGFKAAINSLQTLIRAENLSPPNLSADQSAPSANRASHRAKPDWSSSLLLFFGGVYLCSAFLRRLLGRRLGALATSLGAGAWVWFAGAGFLLAGLAGMVALIFSGVTGLGTMLATGRGVAGSRHVFGGGGWGSGFSGGWGSGFSGGGFTSGGGGDFGGGGSSGDW